jgi:hypothetical protein
MAKGTGLTEARFYQLPGDEVIQIGGTRFAGWVHRRHPDGFLVSKRQPDAEFFARAERAARSGALTEVPRHTDPNNDPFRFLGGRNGH